MDIRMDRSSLLRPLRASGVRSRQRGLSLIEMMIALALGAVLLLGLIEVFGTTRAAYATASGLSRIQENSRFAMEFLRRDARMAAQWGCFNEFGRLPATIFNHTSSTNQSANAPWLFRTDLPVEGFEYEGTAPGDEVALADVPELAEGAGEWSPSLPAALAGAVIGEAVKNSDIIVVRNASAQSVPLDGLNPGGTPPVVSVAAADAGFVENGGVYVIADCLKYSVFQANSDADADGTFAVRNATAQNLGSWQGGEGYAAPAAGGGAPLHRYEVSVYYVALSAAGQPSLMRRRATVASGQTQLSAAEELVEGVESMQVSYAFTNAADVEAATRADEYLSAEDVNDGAAAPDPARWQRVRAMRVGLLLRSPDRGVAGEALRPWVAGNVAFSLGANDERIRDSYDTIISVRNR